MVLGNFASLRYFLPELVVTGTILLLILVAAPDGKLQLMFAPAFGADNQAMRAEAAACL